ncbi:hypothetical protein LTR62_001533 [Meristemomyces frigidus]|uniref:Uncharacterized protein n=1 Tax=Meristemomyces frigidus TaxID=1508187 RepID=A0AAN7TK98_9PEZI|nr:hypothetical protein LTR62_001533 [Meristemomyces frigidus]
MTVAPSSSSQTPAVITQAPAALPTNTAPLNASSVEQCLIEAGGVQQIGQLPLPGCGSIFLHVENCYLLQSPWTDPYNSSQSENFQACLCQTTSIAPFSQDSLLWQNFTGCAHCLEAYTSGILVDTLAAEFSNIENFCCSQNPLAYLVIASFESWLAALNSGLSLTVPPLTGAITEITSLSSLFTTTPPLANLAYGISAPSDGTLAGVTPELTTQTLTLSSGSGTRLPAIERVTSVVGWKPTAAPSGTVASSFNTAAASISAASAARSQLEGALETIAAQGGPSQHCHGPCANSANSLRRKTAIYAVVNVMLAAFLAIALF